VLSGRGHGTQTPSVGEPIWHDRRPQPPGLGCPNMEIEDRRASSGGAGHRQRHREDSGRDRSKPVHLRSRGIPEERNIAPADVVPGYSKRDQSRKIAVP